MSYQYSTTTSLSDETHLEAFVESVSAALPNEMRRVLEHLRDLDDTSCKLTEAWRERQDDCLKGVEGALLDHFRGEAVAAAAAAAEVGGEVASSAGQGKRGRKRRHHAGDGEEGESPDQAQTKKESSSPPAQISADEVSSFLQNRGPPINEEIRTILRARNPQFTSQREDISNMYEELQQLSSEKMGTAHQLKSMVDMALGRLNRDLAKFERELGIDGEAAVAGHPGGAGGIVGVAGSGGAMVGAGMHAQGCYPVASAMLQPVAPPVPTATDTVGPAYQRSSSNISAGAPPPASAMQQPFPTMRGAVPPPPKAITSANLAAIQTKPNSPDWILAKILSHDKLTKTYKLSDEDLHSSQIYNISEKQVVPLKGTEKNKWARGDIVYAVYPDTTSFYHATVSTPPFNGFLMVQFKDDWDANGVTHEKAVLLQHVMKVPPGGK